jgi:hypothetical protein
MNKINTNNMFIWDKNNNTVSKKQIYSKFKNNILKLRKEYNKYIKELYLISNIFTNKTVRTVNIFKKIFGNINSIMIRTEVIVNYLFYYNWEVKNMPQDILLSFSSYITVYCRNDNLLLKSNIDILNKIKDIKINDTKKLVKITSNITNEFKKLEEKSDIIYDSLYKKNN